MLLSLDGVFVSMFTCYDLFMGFGIDYGLFRCPKTALKAILSVGTHGCVCLSGTITIYMHALTDNAKQS